MKNKAKFVSVMLVAVMMLGLLVNAFAIYDTPTFTDVPKNAYYYTYVEEAVANGWINGYGDGRFGPEDKVTYAQMCIMLTKAFFKDELDAYTGPKTTWYTSYCNVASEIGLLEGTNVKNTPTDATAVAQHMNRYEMAQMIYNAMKAANKKMPTNIEVFNARMATADWDAIPKNYRDAVDNCKAAGIINGIDSQGTFAGAGYMSRAHAAIVLTKLNKVENAPETPVEPDPVVPDKPVEITRSPFAFKDGSENVEQMMTRLNNEAPNYFEGYLSNGKPITENNIKAMIESAKVSMPNNTQWDTTDRYWYRRNILVDNHGVYANGGCGAFGLGLSDYIFGKNAPVSKHQNFDQLKIGDLIYLLDSSTGTKHVVMVTGFGNNKYIGDYFIRGEGNNSGTVEWRINEYVGQWSTTKLAESYVYSRY